MKRKTVRLAAMAGAFTCAMMLTACGTTDDGTTAVENIATETEQAVNIAEPDKTEEAASASSLVETQIQESVVTESSEEEEDMSTEFITVFTQNSIRIDGEKKIYIDPFRMQETPGDGDVIFITHAHYDHFSPEDMEKVMKASGTTLVMPASMKDKASEGPSGIDDIVYVTPGESGEVSGVKFETIPAYNIGKKFHPRDNEWVGYIFDIDGKRIYIAGDTDATPEAQAVKCDIALIPIGGTYTMDAEEAAELINIIEPKVAIPVHYGSVVGSPEDAMAFTKAVNGNITVEVKIP